MQVLDEGRSSRNNAPGDKRAAGADPLDGADVANKPSWELWSGLCRGVCQATSNQVLLFDGYEGVRKALKSDAVNCS